MSTILETIVAAKRLEVEELPNEDVTTEFMADLAMRLGPRRDFLAALKNPRVGDVGLIAEIKKASPSAGVIQKDFNLIEIAQAYADGGAGCISVLTDEQFFQGSLEYLSRVREEVGLPLLRKDFMIDPRQFPEALKAGADAVLLIAAILDDRQLVDFRLLSEAAGMAVLVEVHDQLELQRALRSGARLIGVNNRNLKTFEVDLHTTIELAEDMQPLIESGEVFLVSESGIHQRADIERLNRAGAGAFLVGESLMRQGNPREKIRELLQA
ncbi:MAG: indole-3-glycerol phosphate synthase TrpC [Verrucomicrobia bacterium]|nr:indole-3-glycerol phosphate synthase TrpC [Verrucomicrobiota bacterium]